MFAYSTIGITAETLYYFAIAVPYGGPVVLIWTWLASVVFSICVAASMAEMCSVYPYVGSVYHWSAAYSPSPGIARPISYVVGMTYFIGCIAYDVAVGYGCS